MTEEAAPLVPPTPDEEQAIMRLTAAIDRVLTDEDGPTVMSALVSIIVNFAAHVPPYARAEIRNDVAYLKAMVDAMGDAAPAEALELARQLQPGQCFEDPAPAGDGITRH